MHDQSIQTTDIPPWQAIKKNLRELIRAWNAAHKSVFGFHWKKIPPFCWAYPQVDYLRIQRVMETIKQQAEQQAAIANRLQKAAENTPGAAPLRAYYLAVAPYAQALVPVCTHLQTIAAIKQEKLVKGKMGLGNFNHSLKDYEKAIEHLKSRVDPMRIAWNNLEPSQRGS